MRAVRHVAVAVQAGDPVILAGLNTLVRGQPGIDLVPVERRDEADVVLAGTDRLTPDLIAGLRRAADDSTTPVLLVIGEITEKDLPVLMECRVVGVIPRSAATADRLRHGLRAAASGAGVLPPELVGDLIRHADQLRRDLRAARGLAGGSLQPREIEILRLMADGLDSAEIAARMSYSPQTIKKILYGVTQRLGLRNRAHAVAYALRHGVL